MYKLLSKNGQTFGFLLGAVITLLFVVIMSLGWGSFSSYGESPERYNTTIFNFGIYAAMGLVILGVLAVAVFGLFQMASNPKAALRGIIGVAMLVVVFIIAYSTASGEATGAIAKAAENAGGLSSNTLKLISGGITTALVLSGLAALAIVGSELRNFFK